MMCQYSGALATSFLSSAGQIQKPYNIFMGREAE